MIRSQALRDSARGEACTLNIAGVCNYSPETTVLAHLPFFGPHGSGIKTHDHIAAFACSACHTCIDDPGRLPPQDRYLYAARGMGRTQLRWIERGLITVKGVKGETRMFRPASDLRSEAEQERLR